MQPIGAGSGVISPNAYLARGSMGWYQGLSTGNPAVYVDRRILARLWGVIRSICGSSFLRVA